MPDRVLPDHVPATLLQVLLQVPGACVFASSVVPSATHFVKLRSRPSNLAKAPQRLLEGATDFDPSAEQAALRIPSRPDPELCRAASDLAPSLPTSVLWVKAHGIFEPRAPTASYLRLRAEGRSDGKWTLEEIAQAGLEVDVVFLQACHGADATDAPGDQVDSVARAFIAGGARAVVAPLGEVDAQASQDLARAFRRHFAGGRSAAQALRQAQLELGGERWPLYVLYGDGGVRAAGPCAGHVVSRTICRPRGFPGCPPNAAGPCAGHVVSAMRGYERADASPCGAVRDGRGVFGGEPAGELPRAHPAAGRAEFRTSGVSDSGGQEIARRSKKVGTDSPIRATPK